MLPHICSLVRSSAYSRHPCPSFFIHVSARKHVCPCARFLFVPRPSALLDALSPSSRRWTLPSIHGCTSCWTVGSWGRARQSTQPARAGVNPKRRDVSPSRPSWCHLLLQVPPFTSQSPPPASSSMVPPMLRLQSSMAISGFTLDPLLRVSHPE